MAEYRKNQILEEFRRPQGNKSSRSRDIKARLHHLKAKETFLTDTQTSDYTKSSGEINLPRMDHLEDTIRKLERENAELRQRVIDLKASQCFEIKEEKLKNIIKETDRLRQQLENTRKELEQSIVERDFLERFNKNIKAECEALTKENLKLKASMPPPQPRKTQRNIYLSREDQGSNHSRNESSEHRLKSKSKRKEFMQWRKDKQDKQKDGVNTLLKASRSASGLHEDYYGGTRTSRNRPFKNH